MKHLRGECQHCGGHLEFPAESIGLQAPCPHCGQQTELLLERPPEEPSLPRRVIVWTVAAIVVLGLGLLILVLGLKRAERWAAKQKQERVGQPALNADTGGPPLEASSQTPATSGNHEFSVSKISLEKAPGTSLVYAVGTVKNNANKQRFGIKLELDLLNADGQKVGAAKDYQAVLEPGAEWRFKALVVEPKGVVSVKVASLKEDQ
jgi:hypothetical protein